MTKPPALASANCRQLPNRILLAAHQAADLGDLETASKLLRLVEIVLKDKVSRSEAHGRRTMEELVAAHERIWDLSRQGRAKPGIAIDIDVAPSIPWTEHQNISLAVTMVPGTACHLPAMSCSEA